MADKAPYAGFVKNEFNDPLLRMVGGWYNKEYYDTFKAIHFAFKVLPEGATIHGNKAIPNRKLTSDTSSNNVYGDPSIANDKDFINDLDAMMKAAGTNTYSSGYRTLSYINGTNAGGKKSKNRAPAGGSEHQTGYCVDTPNIDITPAQFNKINAVAHRYGFVQTFTAANNSKTNVMIENWHWKWVGNAKARALLTPIDGSLAGMMALSYGSIDKAIEWSKKVKTRDTGTLYEALKNDFEALKAGKTVTGSGVGGTSSGSTSSDTTNGGGEAVPSTSTTARKPTNTGAPSVCKNLAVDPRVKEAFELAFKALYPDGKVDFGPVPTSQPPLGQNVPSPAGPGNPNYQQVPPTKEDSDKSGTESTSNIPVAG